MVGLRGVGKTVLLDCMRNEASNAGMQTVSVESVEDRTLPALLVPQLRQALLAMSRHARAEEAARRALRALAGFVNGVGLRYGDVELRLDLEPEQGLADSGDLDHDLPALLLAAGDAAREAQTVLSLFVDELQYIDRDGLAALIGAMHEAARRESPVMLIGAGLPQLRGRMGEAKSYAERLFDFSEVGALAREAVRQAIVRPAQAQGVTVDDEALECMVEATEGYPYFLQEWGKHAWNVADGPAIHRRDVERASAIATRDLDESFFRVRLDRLTESEQRYLRAMAELGTGPHRSGDIAAVLQRPVTSLGPTRSRLIAKGMVWSPRHGHTDFTVPLFDQFMRRIMPWE